jgi:hypothetical protein
VISKKDVARLRAEMSKPCGECVEEAFQYLMDARVQERILPFVASREGLIQLHVHLADPWLGKGFKPQLLFLTLVRVTADVPMLYWAPGSRTIAGAFKHLRETLRLEKQRLRNPRIHGTTLE